MLPFIISSFAAPDGTSLAAFNPAFENVQGFMQIQDGNATADGMGVTDSVAVADGAWAADQFAECVIAALGDGVYVGVSVRNGAAGSGTFYNYFGNESQSFFTRWVAGGFTVLGTGTAFNAGNTIRLEAVGDELTPLIDGGSDIGPFTDAMIPAGRGGLSGYSGGPLTSQIASFITGNLGAPAPAGGLWMPSMVPGL